MKPQQNRTLVLSLSAAAFSMALAGALYFGSGGSSAQAQDAQRPAPAAPPAAPAPVQSPPAVLEVAPQAPAPAPAPPPNAPAPGAAAPTPASAPVAAAPTNNAPPAATAAATNEVQLSFQGANIEMVVQWLAKTTGKSVVKHPRVQCQLTIVGSKGLSPREALNLVYRALALEGFSTVETSNSIMIVPEGQEPKTTLELMDASQNEIPEGRQKLVKIFQLKHLQPADVRDKIKSVVSDKAVIEINDRASQLIVTDYTDTVRLVGELINELDVSSSSDTTIEFFPLKYSEAEELSTLINAVMNSQALPPSASPAPLSASRSSSSRSMPMMPMPMPGGDGGSSPGGASAAGGGGGQLRLWPDKTSNRLIAMAPKAKIAEIKRLVDLLDTPKPQDVSVRVLTLKFVSAEDLVREIGPLYQRLSGKSAKDVIEVTANLRSNSLIILSSEANYKAIEKLIASLDTDDALEKVTRVFTLRNADAEDVAKQLKELSQDQQSGASRYVYYFNPFESGGNRGKKMSVVADRRRNTVIVQAAPGAMDGLAKMIEELDEPVSDNSLAPKIIPLRYVSAVDIEDVLNELFLKKDQQRGYWDYVYEYELGASSNSKDDAGRMFGKVRITSEPYSNSIIITSNSPENLAAVEEVIKQLDRPSEAGETTLRVQLKFAESINLASSLNILFARGGAPALRPQQQQPNQNDGNRGGQPNQTSARPAFELQQETKEDAYFPWLGGQQENNRPGDSRSASRPVSDLIGRVRVVPDRRSNSLLITSNVHFFPQVLKLITEMDAPTAQVLIEAKIIEVSADFRDKMGVRWSPDGTRTFDAEDMDNSIKIGNDVSLKNVFIGTPMGDAFRSGVIDSQINLDILVQFLRKNTGATVLAEPQINVSDNEVGKLFVGSRVPFITGSLNTPEGGRNDTFDYKDVGVILEVIPHINNAEEVALKVRAESSSLRDQTLFGGAIVDTRNFQTDMLVRNGQTLVLGGIIQKQDVNTLRKTPVLGSIPGLGWAFKKKDKVSRDVELMVFLRPRITRTPKEAQELLEELNSRTPRLQEWKEKSKQSPEERRKG